MLPALTSDARDRPIGPTETPNSAPIDIYSQRRGEERNKKEMIRLALEAKLIQRIVTEEIWVCKY